MTNINIAIEVSEEMTIKGAGATMTVDLTKYCDEALQYIFEYGLNRAHQDRANSIAHKLKGEGEEPDGDAILADVVKALQEGNISRRGTGSGVDPVTAECLKMVRPMVKAADKDWYKNASAEERNEKVAAAWEKIVADGKDEGFRKTAKARIEKAKAEKAEELALAAELGDLEI